MNDIPNIDWPRTYFTRGAAISDDEIGYVIWSSTRSGLRPIHSVKMITCASDRSGIASSGARDSESHPHTPRPSTSRTVISGLRALPAITRPMAPARSLLVAMAVPPERGGRPHATLGRDEEVARADHDVALVETARDLDDVAGMRADRDLLRA